jgi:hypothetical protein
MRFVMTFFVLTLTFVILEVLVALLGGVLALWPMHRAWLECLVAAIRRSPVLLFLFAFVVVVMRTAVNAILPFVVMVVVLTAFAGKVGCWRVETRVKTTDMCLSGQCVADMLADMLAT